MCLLQIICPALVLRLKFRFYRFTARYYSTYWHIKFGHPSCSLSIYLWDLGFHTDKQTDRRIWLYWYWLGIFMVSGDCYDFFCLLNKFRLAQSYNALLKEAGIINRANICCWGWGNVQQNAIQKDDRKGKYFAIDIELILATLEYILL